MLTRVLFKFQCVALWMLLGLPVASAHEFWLEPVKFTVEKGANIQAHIKVGEALDGETYAFYPANFERFELMTANGSEPVNNRFAQEPAFDQPPSTDGLHVLLYQSKRSKLRYESRDIFEKFLMNEGIEWVKEAHKKRNLPALAFTELYQRFAKTLIGVGHSIGQDRQTGMLFEWVLLSNPYTADASRETIKAQLLFQGKPFADSSVNVFVRRGEQVLRNRLKTNANGVVEVPVQKGGLFLINAVHMIEPATDSKAAWMSLWASTTFLIASD